MDWNRRERSRCFPRRKCKPDCESIRFWGRKVSLDSLTVKQPRMDIRVGKNGETNVPSPRRPRSAKPLGQTLLDLHIRHVKLENGWMLYNDVKTPLEVEGDNLRLALDAGGPLDHMVYVGNLDWQNIRFVAKRFLPVPVSVAAKFSVSRDGFTLEQGVFSAAHSHVDAQAEMTNFADPRWSMKYRGWLELVDLRETFRQPLVPTGRADFRGEGTLTGGQFHGTGSYSGRDIALPYDDFHAKGLTSHGTVQINNDGLVVPDFYAGALGRHSKGARDAEICRIAVSCGEPRGGRSDWRRCCRILSIAGFRLTNCTGTRY